MEIKQIVRKRTLFSPVLTEVHSDFFDISNRRYTGSKAKLSNWIISLIRKECEGEVFADIFAGTGIIATNARPFFSKVIVNDILHSNNIIYKAFFGNENWNKKRVTNIVNSYNDINPKQVEENYFSINFGDKYFDNDTAKLIGYIRSDLENQRRVLAKKEYDIILASLLYSADKVANTVGHYDAFFQKTPTRSNFKLKLIRPLIDGNFQIFKKDANELVKEIEADVIYIDPPYNSRQYSRFYHLLETLVKWDNPKLHGVALKPDPENMSDYSKNSALATFSDLVGSLKCKYIVVSYNNTYNSKSSSSRNKINLESIKEVLNSRGKTQVFSKAHKFFNAGKTNFDNHQEMLFITKCH